MEKKILYTISDKCIIIDLDQTLIYTQEDISLTKKDFYDKISHRIYNIKLDDNEIIGIFRPYVQEFLLFCFCYFKVVAVWSAGQKDYVNAMVDILFPTRKPNIVFTFDDTVEFGEDFIKPIEKLIKHDPFYNKFMNIKNTFILDDYEITAIKNKYNIILIPAYGPNPDLKSILRSEESLLQFKHWLLQPNVVNSKDVRLLDKSNIFNVDYKDYKNIGYVCRF